MLLSAIVHGHFNVKNIPLKEILLLFLTFDMCTSECGYLGACIVL